MRRQLRRLWAGLRKKRITYGPLQFHGAATGRVFFYFLQLFRFFLVFTHERGDTMKRILIAALCLLLLTGAVSAKSSGELRQELNALQAQAEALRTQGTELEEQLEANRTDTQSTIDKKFAVDQQIRQTEAELENVNAQIRQYSLLIAGKQSDLEAAQQAYDLNKAAELNYGKLPAL